MPLNLWGSRFCSPFPKQSYCFQDFARKRGEAGTPWCLATLALLLLPLFSNAQGTPASTIYGYILDPDQRPIPGARIVVEDQNTDATRITLTNQQGFHSVPALRPGPYDVTIEANGFATIHQTGTVLEADQQARLDFTLKVGSTSETITVEGSAPLLNTSDATVSTLIGNQFVNQHATERPELQLAS